MFERSDGIRLTHSPSGGVNNRQQTTNPAWDFQYIIPKYEVRTEYGFRARVVYREHCDRAEVSSEWESGVSLCDEVTNELSAILAVSHPEPVNISTFVHTYT
jgi:hypothetical protein